MGEFLADYGLFLAKTLTVLAALGLALGMVASASRKGDRRPGLVVEKLNNRYRDMRLALQRAALPKSGFRRAARDARKRGRADEREGGRRRYFVIDFKGDIRASGVAQLREEISAVLTIAGPDDQVLLRLENAGGAVHEHGLAASQLMRLKARNIPLVVLVDKVAASGGYLMACVAERIIAAPFAVIGSIGVVAQLPNFSRALKDKGVDFEQITAGRYKRTLTMFGENTEEARTKLREELEDVHRIFKELVVEHRPVLDVERIATGEYWYGKRALELGLVDELGASDDLLMQAAQDGDVFQVRWRGKPGLQERLLAAMDAAAGRLARWPGRGPTA